MNDIKASLKVLQDIVYRGTKGTVETDDKTLFKKHFKAILIEDFYPTNDFKKLIHNPIKARQFLIQADMVIDKMFVEVKK